MGGKLDPRADADPLEVDLISREGGIGPAGGDVLRRDLDQAGEIAHDLGDRAGENVDASGAPLPLA